jgi:hypothetical protein
MRIEVKNTSLGESHYINFDSQEQLHLYDRCDITSIVYRNRQIFRDGT